MDKNANILLGKSKINLARFQESPQHFSHEAISAKASEGHAYCLCTVPHPKLVIARRAGRYYVAGWPNEGHLHHFECVFYKTQPGSSGIDQYTQESLQVAQDGTFSVKLKDALSLEIGVGDRQKSEVQSSNISHKTHRRASSLLSLLHYLWEQSNLNRWHANWKRNWFIARHHLLQTLSKGVVGKKELEQITYVVPQFDHLRIEQIRVAWESWSRPFIQSATRADHLKQNGGGAIIRIDCALLLGRIKSLEPSSKGGYILKLKDHAYPIYAKSDLIGALLKSFPFLAKTFESQSEAVALLLVLPHPKGYFSLIDLGAMQTTKSLIPIDSSYELQVANMLVEQGRSFTKPLRYNQSDAVFPDFILFDTRSRHTIMEIYGLSGNEGYDLRKLKKNWIYSQNEADLWVWDLEKSPKMPLLPSKLV